MHRLALAAPALLAACVASAPPPVYLPPADLPPIAQPAPGRPALRPAIARASCVPPAASTLALLPSDAGKPVVAMRLNGRPARMQVDTGAETSVLTESGAATLGLAPGPSRRQVAGLGGAAGYGTVQMNQVDFAGAAHSIEVPVMQLAGASSLTGLIGADLLAGTLVAFDFPARRMQVRPPPPPGCPSPPAPPSALPWAGDRLLPIVRARLDGRTVLALIDTGASASAVDATRAGLQASMLNTDPATRAYGAGGLPIAGRLHRFGRIELGTLVIDAPKLRVIALDPTLGIDLVIGMDLLAGRRLWLDYEERRAFLDRDDRF